MRSEEIKPYSISGLNAQQKRDIARIYEYADWQVGAGQRICGMVISLDSDHIKRIARQADLHASQIAEYGFC